MAGAKDAYEIQFSQEQIEFIRSAKDQYGIPEESKVGRIMVDYLLSNPDIHSAVFEESRCLWCG